MEQSQQPTPSASRGPLRRAGAVRPADEILGCGIYDRSGDRLGDIETLMVDVVTGTIAYAVLAAGGFMGIGARLIAIPWTCLQLDPDHGCFTLDMSAERLERAPSFDRNHWPDMSVRQWGHDVHAFFGVPPYWER